MVEMRYMIGYLNKLRRMLERGDCHPDWGTKRIARMEKRIGLKETLLHKRAALQAPAEVPKGGKECLPRR